MLWKLGGVPSDVTVRYPNGNTFVSAGTYEVTAICYGDKYETKELVATLTIEKAVYDMSGVSFDDAEYVYDKSAKSVSIDGSLPDGVTVEYKIGDQKGNSKVNAGEYTVVASFSSKNSNYEKIADMSATLKINKAKFADFDLEFENKSVVYSGQSYKLEADLTSLPNGVTTNYTIQKIKNAKGENVDESVASGNQATQAGAYVVNLNFVVADTENYENIQSKSATLFIERAVYNLDSIYMYSESVDYDGSEHSITLSGETIGSQPNLPFGISVSYTIKQIKDENGNAVDGAVSDGNSASKVGTYEITAHLTSTDENYYEIDNIAAILIISEEK